MNDLNINYPTGSSHAEQNRVLALALATLPLYHFTPSADEILSRATKFEAYLNNGTPKAT